MDMYKSYSIPVSVKGIVFEAGKVWLRRNQRSERELPGGKMNEGEQPEETVVRELKEELGFETAVVDIIQANLYVVAGSQDEERGVLVLSYLCRPISKSGEFELVGEGGAAKFRQFSTKEVKDLKMPDFYKEAILKSFSDYQAGLV